MKKENKIDFKPEEEVFTILKEKSNKVVKLIKEYSRKNKIKLEVFVGGSYAKDTLVRKDLYDIDIFIRLKKDNFDRDVKKLEKVISNVAKNIGGDIKIVHGSRDYYQIGLVDKKLVFEIIPVLRIRKPEEAENVTDLSYFHVSFMKRKLNTENLRKQVRLAKAFCAACNSYGAESYIQGFSGYALECLIVHYKSLDKMLRQFSQTKEKIVIDSERHYKNNKEILIQLNESKLQSPVVVIDPTWKKRNALASLSNETFERFRQHALAYLKNKSIDYFVSKPVSKDEMSKKASRLGQEMIAVELETDKQEGDIAGTKLKKASNYIIRQLRKEFDIKESSFAYDGFKKATAYIIGKPKKELLLSGPPIKMEKHAAAFRNEHKDVFEKKGKIYARKNATQSMKQYFNEKISNDVNLGLMAVRKARII